MVEPIVCVYLFRAKFTVRGIREDDMLLPREKISSEGGEDPIDVSV